MRALQALVAFLGILILVGVVLVVFAMMHGPKSSLPVAATVPTMAAADTATRVLLPSGFRIAEMVATADRVVLRLDSSDGRQRLVILDPSRGLVTGTLNTTGAP